MAPSRLRFTARKPARSVDELDGCTDTKVIVPGAAGLGRRRRDIAVSKLVAFACLAAMFGVWAKFIEPINQEVRGWTPETVPEDWEEKRERWHSLHAVQLALATVGFVTLTYFALDGTARDGAAVCLDRR